MSRVGALALALGGVTSSIVILSWYYAFHHRRDDKRNNTNDDDDENQPPPSAHEALIGSTPLVLLEKISALVGRNIWVKMESMNPGATGKDRAALAMIRQAEQQGFLPSPPVMVVSLSSSLDLHEVVQKQQTTRNSTTSVDNATTDQQDPTMIQILDQAYQKSRSGGIVVEGTSGSTGIALTTLAISRGHACLVVMPDDQAAEKQAILTALGAIVYVVPTAAISNPKHYVNIARRLTQLACANGIQAAFMNQFENEANFQMHYQSTGPELWHQFQIQAAARDKNKRWTFAFASKRTQHHLAAYVMSAGTGGTIAGMGKYLKEQSHGACQIVLVDPPGSSLYHKVKHGVAFAPQQREQLLQRHRYDTIAEGIGLDRITHNLSLGLSFVDDAIAVSDQEAVDMAHFLLETEGLWVGSSSAMNVVGTIRVASQLEPNAHVVTIICDSGARHATRLWNRDFIVGRGLSWPRDSCNSNDVGNCGHQRLPECLVAFLP
jgi:cysteine synthase